MNMFDVIQWKWPGSRCVTQGDVITLWEGPTTQPTASELDQASLEYLSEQIAEWTALRLDRNARLVVCDWTQLSDAPISSEQVAAWRVYRQSLRNVPQDNSDPSVINWPVAPDGVSL